MPRIVLIQPRFMNEKLDRNIKTLYPIGLGYLAAYVPEHWDVQIIDEQISPINFDIHADIIGISTTTVTANRAYEVAAEFKKRGLTVIFGGVHASMCPDEALNFGDAVCIGDGEEAIIDIINDFEKGNLKKEYIGTLKPLENLKIPRHDLFKKGYSFFPVSTSRGCPFNCHFCAINRFYGGHYRTRDPEDVIEDLKRVPRDYEVVFFTDGNMYGYTDKDVERFKILCKRIAEEQKKGTFNFKYFTGYGSVNMLDDDEALDLASKAGCRAAFVGFESINPDSLKDMNKKLNLKYGVESYKRLVSNAQKRKILVVGEMILGNDSDDADVLKKTADFLRTVNFDILRLQILQPLPGTKLYENLAYENRLLLQKFPEDWQKIAEDFVLGVHYKVKKLEPRELQRWIKKTGMEFYSFSNIFKRALKSLIMTRDIKFAATIIVMSLKSKKSYANANV